MLTSLGLQKTLERFNPVAVTDVRWPSALSLPTFVKVQTDIKPMKRVIIIATERSSCIRYCRHAS